MLPQDDLFDLIRSLSPAEKKFFKLHAGRYSSSSYKKQYEKLFDALNGHTGDTYDEREFKRKHRNKDFVKDLASAKSKLYALILKVLRDHYINSNPDSDLHEMLFSIRPLISKGLRRQSVRLIERAMQLAEDTEQYNEILVIHDQLLRIYRNNPTEAPYTARQIEQMDREVLERITLTRQALYLRIHMGEIEARAQWRIREQEAQEIMDRAIELSASPYLTRRADLALHNVRQIYLIHYHRYQDCLDLTAEWLDKIEKDPRTFAYSTDQYRIMLSNYLNSALKSDNMELLPVAIEKVRALKADTDKEAAENFRVGTLYELIYLMNSEPNEREDKVVMHLEEGLKRHRRFLAEPQLVYFRFNIIILCFVRKKYSDTIRHLNELYYLSGRNESYAYTTTMARVIEWMSHYSLREYAILDSSLRNLKKYFSDRQLRDDCFDAIFDVFTVKLKKAGTRPASMDSFRKRISDSSPSPEWEQLKQFVLEWI